MNIESIEVAAPTARMPKISWGAVFAGVVAILVTQLLLSVLGIGIGASTINPASEQDPMSGIGIGAGIWLILSALIAFFVGGWMAGRLAGIPRNLDSLLHGVLAWALAVLLTIYLVTTTVGSLISGAAGVLGRGVSLAGQGMAEIAPDIAQAVTGGNATPIIEEARRILQEAKRPGTDVQAVATELTTIFNRILTRDDRSITASDREALINVLVNNTTQTRPEATGTVSRWSEQYQQLRTGWQETRGEGSPRGSCHES